MKHRVAFRKLSRPTAHRMLMLRNMVTSLIEHEQIKTTLPKAREAARLAEKIITLGKKGTLPAARQVQGFILKPSLSSKIFGLLAHRYAGRPGGYTRIHKFGTRPGDNAPSAVLELVDNPRDLRFEVTARAVGWEMLGKEVKGANVVGSGEKVVENAVRGVEGLVRQVKAANGTGTVMRDGFGGRLRVYTRQNLQKVLRYRGEPGVKSLTAKAEQYIKELSAEPLALQNMQQSKLKSSTSSDSESPAAADTVTVEALKNRTYYRAGDRFLASAKSGYATASGVFSRRLRRVGLGLPGH